MRFLEKVKCLSGMKMIEFRLGGIIKCKDNKCYQIHEFAKLLYYFYYFILINLLLLYFFFQGLMLISNIFFGIFFSLLVVYIFEHILLLITPMKEVKCYLMELQNRKKGR